MPATKKPQVRISSNLPENDFFLLQYLANVLGISMVDVIRRGIRSEDFFRSVREEGGQILIKNKDGSLDRVIEKP